MHLQERTELSRLAVDGVDAEDGSRVEIIGSRYAQGFALYVPAASHTVYLPPNAVAQLAGAMSPDAPITIVVSIESSTGEWTHLPAQVSHGRDLPERTVRSLRDAMQDALTRLGGSWVPPVRRTKKTA